MSGEIRSIRDSAGVSHQIDYQSLANKPFAAPTSEDSGKSLVVDEYGSPAWESVLPAYDTSDDGKVLAVGNCGESIEWATSEGSLPSYTPSDAGSSLVIDDNGDPAWMSVLPSLTSDGDVLTISNDMLAWVTPVGVPSTDGAEDGDVLTVGDCGNSVSWEPLVRVPSYSSSDAGTFLRVDDNGEHVEWAIVLPPHDSSDAGKTLTVNEYGGLEWA